MGLPVVEGDPRLPVDPHDYVTGFLSDRLDGLAAEVWREHVDFTPRTGKIEWHMHPGMGRHALGAPDSIGRCSTWPAQFDNQWNVYRIRRLGIRLVVGFTLAMAWPNGLG